jgi:hypothetical protein
MRWAYALISISPVTSLDNAFTQVASKFTFSHKSFLSSFYETREPPNAKLTRPEGLYQAFKLSDEMQASSARVQ